MLFFKSYPLILFGLLVIYVLVCQYKNKFPHARSYSHKKNCVRIACVGDSITQGYGTKYVPHLSYPAVLQRKLRRDKTLACFKKYTDKASSRCVKFEVRNFGKNSATVMHDLPESYIDHPFYRQVLHSNADIIFFMLGTNDSKVAVWKDADLFKTFYTDILASFAAMASSPRIVLMYPPKAYKPDLWENSFFTIQDQVIKNEIIPTIHKIADELHLEIIDIYNLTDNHRTWFGFDGIHPNGIGAYEIASLIADFL